MNSTEVQKDYDRLKYFLHESSMPFSILTIITIIITVIVIAALEWFEGPLFILVIAINFVFLNWTHKKMIRNPINNAIELYIKSVKESGLSGEELIQLKALPTNQDYGRFSKFGDWFKGSAIAKLYSNLTHLTFENDKKNSEYQITVEIIQSVNEKKNS